MIELGKLLIDDEAVQALRDWLDVLVQNRRSQLAAAARLVEEEETRNRRYERICDLARQTARVNGAVEGLAPGYVATAAWEAFIANEGWFSTFDVDDYWSERDDPEFQEGWELAYVEEVELLKKQGASSR